MAASLYFMASPQEHSPTWGCSAQGAMGEKRVTGEMDEIIVSMKGQSSPCSSAARILGQLEWSLHLHTKLEIKSSKSSCPCSNALFSVPYGISTILGKQLYKITRATEIHYNLCMISV